MNADTVRELLRNTQTIDAVENIMAREALEDAAPAVARWGLERDAEVARLREALERVAYLSAKAVSEDVEEYYTNEMGRTARAALEGTS